MATAALLVVPFFHPNFRSAVWRVGALSLSLTIGLGLFYTPVFQKRFFHSGSGGLSDLLTDDFASFGRFEAWPYVWKAAWVHPAWGAGVGSTYELVDQVWPEAHHIHNDYLRLFYELGFLGLGCFAVVVLWQCSDLLRKMQRAEGESRRLFSAAFLGLMYYAMLASTDNPVVYCAIFTNPLFALMGAAYGLSVGEDSSASLPVQPSLPQPSYPRSSLPQPTLLPQKTPPHPA
jgi:O-antigen ligase